VTFDFFLRLAGIFFPRLEREAFFLDFDAFFAMEALLGY
jgi:hypothetical protein